LLDATDLGILKILSRDARMSWKDIGRDVHMTGQAVAARIKRMEETGVIQGYTVALDYTKLGKPVTCYLTVYMKTNDHASFQSFLKDKEEVREAHRISGGGCYLIKANVADNESLNVLLDEILKYGNYGMSLSIGRIK
jgi:Lrp/AsnC family leucine-responsive transcriptional regulator